MRLLFVINDLTFFLSHRLPLAIAAMEQGYEVHVAASTVTSESRLDEYSFSFHEIPLNRGGINPVQDLRTFVALVRLYRRLSPDIVHHVTIKPVLYGGIACRLLRVPGVVNALAGLGYVFSGKRILARVLRFLLILPLRFACRYRRSLAIVQNPEDRERLVSLGLCEADRIVLIRGSGVDASLFHPLPEKRDGKPVVILASRMLWDKGVGVFVDAVKLLKARGSEARFLLLGGTDPNPNAIPKETLEAWNRSGAVEWLGHREDMPEQLRAADIAALPSYYGEGLPKFLIEAAATGLPIVATDIPGCREIVVDGHNGYLVPVRDSAALADALEKLIGEPGLRAEMGDRGRALVLREFKVEGVVEKTLAVYSRLMDTPVSH